MSRGKIIFLHEHVCTHMRARVRMYFSNKYKFNENVRCVQYTNGRGIYYECMHYVVWYVW